LSSLTKRRARAGRQWVAGNYAVPNPGQHVYDVTADGQHFLTMKAGEDTRERGPAELAVVHNWLPSIRRASQAGQ